MLLLSQHPDLTVAALGASARSRGRRYADVARWKHPVPLPRAIADMTVRSCDPAEYSRDEVDVVFSGLDADVAGDVEMAFLKADFAVFSNAKNYRLNELVPLVIPTVNLDHAGILKAQREHYKLEKGMLLCNSNCAGEWALGTEDVL